MLISLMDDPHKLPVAGRVVWMTPPGCHGNRVQGVGVQFKDDESGSHWDVTGRCVDGQLKGSTLEPVDAVQVKWFAWAAEYPTTKIIE